MAYVDGRMDGQGSCCKHGWQAASTDRLQAGIDGSGCGRQTKIAMSRQGRGLRGRTGRRVQAIPPQSGVTACVFVKSSLSTGNILLGIG